MVQYWYDAWGNHKVVDSNGNAITNANHIGNLNPFRYRGYYFDRETGLYFLQTRYYDPEIGRFLNRDSVAYADPQTINGLNLYAYCLNNPIAYTDPYGTIGISVILLSILGGAILGGVTSGIKAANNGLDFGQIVLASLGGAIMGGAVAGAFALGGAAVAGLTIAGQAINVSGATLFAIAAYSTAAASMADYSLTSLAYDNEITQEGLLLSGLNGFFEGTISFGAGALAALQGYFKYVDRQGLFNRSKNLEKISRTIMFSAPSAILRNIFKEVEQHAWDIYW